MANTPTSATTLKSYFETGDIPTQDQYSDLISSFPNIVDEGLTTGSTDITNLDNDSSFAASLHCTTKYINIVSCLTLDSAINLSNHQAGNQFIISNNSTERIIVYGIDGSSFYAPTYGNGLYLPPNCVLFINFLHTNLGVWQLVNYMGGIITISSASTYGGSITINNLTAINNYHVCSNGVINFTSSIDDFVNYQSWSFIVASNSLGNTLTYDSNFISSIGSLPVTLEANGYYTFTFIYISDIGKIVLVSCTNTLNLPTGNRQFLISVAQSGTTAPTIVTKFNNSGLTVTATRSAVGTYVFTFNKSIASDYEYLPQITANSTTASGVIFICIAAVNGLSVTVYCRNQSNTLVDNNSFLLNINFIRK